MAVGGGGSFWALAKGVKVGGTVGHACESPTAAPIELVAALPVRNERPRIKAPQAIRIVARIAIFRVRLERISGSLGNSVSFRNVTGT